MASTMHVESAFRESLRRAAAAWNDFFFKPRDPTTLGLMRLLAGIFIFYVHLAHTPDLYNFFGPSGWTDATVATQLRKDYPIPQLTTSWTETGPNIVPPMDQRMREVFLLEWAQNLPTDPAQRRDALNYLISLPLNPQYSHDGLAFAEYLVIRSQLDDARAPTESFRFTTDDERNKILDALTREQIAPTEKHLVPEFMQGLSPDDRKTVRRNVLALVDTLPKKKAGDVALIFMYLNHQSLVPVAARKATDPRSELQRTLMFLTEQPDPSHPEDDRGPFMPNELNERREVLKYLNLWTTDPRRTYGRGQYVWSVWYHVTDPTMMAVVHGFFLVVMAMFAAGLWTRITSVITWIAVISYINRCQQMVFGMDTMMNIAMIYLMIGPSGAALSVDRWLEKRRAARDLDEARRNKRDTREFEAILAGPRPSVLANFVTRLVQIHFCFIYAASGLSKLKGPAWWNHTAIWSTIVNPEFSPTVFQPYMWAMLQISEIRWLAELIMTGGAVYTLFIEIGFPFLVWRPLLRPYMVMAGILLHTGIAVLMGLTVFGLFMLVLLMSFVPPETVKRWLELGERRLRGSATAAAPPAQGPHLAPVSAVKN